MVISSTQPDGAASVADREIEQLARLLGEALRALGDAGEPVAANRIGGRAWALLRHRDPAAAQRINGLMHRLARQEAAAAASADRPRDRISRSRAGAESRP